MMLRSGALSESPERRSNAKGEESPRCPAVVSPPAVCQVLPSKTQLSATTTTSVTLRSPNTTTTNNKINNKTEKSKFPSLKAASKGTSSTAPNPAGNRDEPTFSKNKNVVSTPTSIPPRVNTTRNWLGETFDKNVSSAVAMLPMIRRKLANQTTSLSANLKRTKKTLPKKKTSMIGKKKLIVLPLAVLGTASMSSRYVATKVQRIASVEWHKVSSSQPSCRRRTFLKRNAESVEVAYHDAKRKMPPPKARRRIGKEQVNQTTPIITISKDLAQRERLVTQQSRFQRLKRLRNIEKASSRDKKKTTYSSQQNNKKSRFTRTGKLVKAATGKLVDRIKMSVVAEQVKNPKKFKNMMKEMVRGASMLNHAHEQKHKILTLPSK